MGKHRSVLLDFFKPEHHAIVIEKIQIGHRKIILIVEHGQVSAQFQFYALGYGFQLVSQGLIFIN